MSSTNGSLVRFGNCRILRSGQIIREDVWVRRGVIVNPEKVFFDEKVEADASVDCGGALIAPGFIDVQINGGFGVDFSERDRDAAESVAKVAKGLLEFGVTAFCPTVVTSSPETYRRVLPRIQKREGGKEGAAILGLHLEGPFINPGKKGAHEEKYIRRAEKGIDSLTEVYGSLENVRYVTLAPEIPDACSVIRELRRRNVQVSLGHSEADLKEGEAAVESGASFVTHLFNAMLPFHHRDPGLVGLLTSDRIPAGRTVHYGIIADGVHTHPAALRIAHRTHPEGLVLVTDAIAALGLKDGTYRLGRLDVEVQKGRAYLVGTNTLCGSTADMATCVRRFKEATGCSVVEALEAATLHPARALGIDQRKGVLDFGADADFVMLDERLNVLSTWIAGERVYP